MPGGVGAGVPDPTAGKLKEYKGGDADAKGVAVAVAEVEGGVVAIFAFVGISLERAWQALQRRSENCSYGGIGEGTLDDPGLTLILYT